MLNWFKNWWYDFAIRQPQAGMQAEFEATAQPQLLWTASSNVSCLSGFHPTRLDHE